MVDLHQDVQYLKGVGPRRAELLAKLDIKSVGDLLFHFPRSFDDLSDIRSVADLEPNTLQTVHGEVVEIEGKELHSGKNIVSIVIADPGGKCLEGIWFSAYAARGYRFGQKLAFSGKPKWFRDHWQMNNPRVQVLDQGDAGEAKVVPVYPLTENLRADQLRDMIRKAVDSAAGLVPEIVPDDLLRLHHYPQIADALERLHFPRTLPEGLNAKQRFIYEEFLVLQVALALRRRDIRDRQKAPPLPVDRTVDEHIRRLFPFQLTGDQNKAIARICKDLAQDRPMQRLLQADVGAGKTAVAVYALLVAVANKHQAILMAPTEILARQHWRTVEGYLAKSRVRRLLLTGALSPKERKTALSDIQAGNIDLVVGTQALVQEDVQFHKLGLVVIDEQHKFGVNQRARVRKLGEESVDPHYLVMTATPIPRTVALTVFGDLDTSTIKQLPPGRQPVQTRWLTEAQRERIYEYLAEQMRLGKQAYFVYPLVGESETLDLKSAEKMFATLKEGAFEEFRLGLLHGRMDEEEKDRVMESFRAREIDLLVTTVVIEVGVDVPNATLLLVEHAERFGLSQLHQLRGRISRGTVAGECLLFSGLANEEARQRLKAFTRTTDGFMLAEEDARLRGTGEFFGTRQHGLPQLKIADITQEIELLQQAREDALEILAKDPKLSSPEHRLLRDALIRQFGNALQLAQIG
jgi:ATP-dependent DNA helicase RecG